MPDNESKNNTQKNDTPKPELDTENEEESLGGDDDEGVERINAPNLSEFDDSEDDGDEDPEHQRAERETSLRRPNNPRELLTEYVVRRAERSGDKLRTHLIGKIMVNVEDKNENYLFDWSEQRPSSAENKSASATPDCTIKISEANLMRIMQGDLNPQIAMISSKIKVEGRPEFAVYFFNLVAPPGGTY